MEAVCCVCSYMKRQGITAETPLVIKYQPALREGEETVLPSANDWISDVLYCKELGKRSCDAAKAHRDLSVLLDCIVV